MFTQNSSFAQKQKKTKTLRYLYIRSSKNLFENGQTRKLNAKIQNETVSKKKQKPKKKLKINWKNHQKMNQNKLKIQNYTIQWPFWYYKTTKAYNVEKIFLFKNGVQSMRCIRSLLNKCSTLQKVVENFFLFHLSKRFTTIDDKTIEPNHS